MECSFYDLKDSFIGKQMLKSVERSIAKGFDGVADYKNVNFKMLMENACNIPIKNMMLVNPDGMKYNTAQGIIEIANGHLLKGIRYFRKKDN